MGFITLPIEAAANRQRRDRASEDGVRDKLYRAEFGLFTGTPLVTDGDRAVVKARKPFPIGMRSPSPR